jgi:hypothetical protein
VEGVENYLATTIVADYILAASGFLSIKKISGHVPPEPPEENREAGVKPARFRQKIPLRG